MFGLGEAMLGFLRRQVGLRTDAADANGSLHAKVGDLATTKHNALASGISSLDTLINSTLRTILIASDTLRVSNDSEKVNNDSDSWQPMKASLPLGAGIVRVSFDLRSSSSSYDAIARIMVDETQAGPTYIARETYVTHTADVPVNHNSVIRIETRGARLQYVRNFRLYYNYSTFSGLGTALY